LPSRKITLGSVKACLNVAHRDVSSKRGFGGGVVDASVVLVGAAAVVAGADVVAVLAPRPTSTERLATSHVPCISEPVQLRDVRFELVG
jgi:hypothetical protein